MKNVTSKVIIDRLPLYFRALRQSQNEGMEKVSSEQLGQRLCYYNRTNSKT